jgi:hypothetical protein
MSEIETTASDDLKPWSPEELADVERETELDEARRKGADSVARQMATDMVKWLKQQMDTYDRPSLLKDLGVNSPAEDFKTAALLANGMHDEFKAALDGFLRDYGGYLVEEPDVPVPE